ncbi:MAG: hypothetical protein B6245_17020 [Desulfobacteraceae bacterium 4572_88]|nr:MAG: hypothetical protein B6245_17020 [Desulfobacteraceae bacterium 4572_88]
MQTLNLEKLPTHARVELLDFYAFLLKKYASHKVCSPRTTPIKGVPAKQLRLGDLAVKLFGSTAGIELELPRCPPHDPI